MKLSFKSVMEAEKENGNEKSFQGVIEAYKYVCVLKKKSELWKSNLRSLKMCLKVLCSSYSVVPGTQQ
jgi:hypothetical protein